MSADPFSPDPIDSERLSTLSSNRLAIVHRRLRSPSDDGGILCEPSLASFAQAAHDNKQRLDSANSVCILDQPLPQLRDTTRAFLLTAANKYTAGERGETTKSPRFDSTTPFILAGHQPTLFHPGVWAKNYALAASGRAASGVTVNLIIDNDVVGRPAIAVPTGSLSEPRVEAVPIDSGLGGMPWEERPVADASYLADFADRVRETLLPYPSGQPLLYGRWQKDQLRSDLPLGECLAAWRRSVEAEFGIHNLELPLSQLCQGESFLRFFLHILLHADAFRDIYNRRLHEYRKVNKIRSRSHPVPDLIARGGAVELPFWSWRSGSDSSATSVVRRQGLFVRFENDLAQLQFGDNHETALQVPLPKNAASINHALQVLREASAQGLRIRPRALMTTLFLRLCAGDLFVHGIGGAKYDQLTDALMADFFRITPPQFATVTATFRLPLDRPAVTAADANSLRNRLRELEFHPEQFLSAGQGTEWQEQKAAWTHDVSAEQRRKQFEQISEANAKMQQLLVDEVTQTKSQLQTVEQQLRMADKLGSREFSFCLFPESLGEQLKQAFSVA